MLTWRRLLASVLVGSACLGAPGWAGPPATPAPTVTVTMATPAGAEKAPTVQATWNVTRVGHAASLVVRGAAVLQTTVSAVWTSAPLAFKNRWSGIGVNLSWGQSGMPPAGTATQTIRVRFTDSKGYAKGRWGRWLYVDDPAFDTSPGDLVVDTEKVYDLAYPGKTPAKGIRAQLSLTDVLPPGTTIDQGFDITAQ